MSSIYAHTICAQTRAIVVELPEAAQLRCEMRWDPRVHTTHGMVV